MTGTNCDVCGCDHETHYHARKKPVTAEETVEDILHDIKKMYDKRVMDKQHTDARITTLEADLKTLDNVLKEKEKEIGECCRELKAICRHFNFVTELISVIHTMEANAATLTAVHARKQADEMIENIRKLADNLTIRAHT